MKGFTPENAHTRVQHVQSGSAACPTSNHTLLMRTEAQNTRTCLHTRVDYVTKLFPPHKSCHHTCLHITSVNHTKISLNSHEKAGQE